MFRRDKDYRHGYRGNRRDGKRPSFLRRIAEIFMIGGIIRFIRNAMRG